MVAVLTDQSTILFDNNTYEKKFFFITEHFKEFYDNVTPFLN